MHECSERESTVYPGFLFPLRLSQLQQWHRQGERAWMKLLSVKKHSSLFNDVSYSALPGNSDKKQDSALEIPCFKF